MKIRSKWLVKFLAWFLAATFRALSRTLRIDGHIETPGTDPSYLTARTFIYALWHDSIFIPLARAAITRPKIAALVSRHHDGAYLAAFMQHLDVRSIHGSTNRGGDQALRSLLNEADDHHIFITPDGPRGPHHETKEGMIYLASRTGRPIVLIASRYADAWHLQGRWTGLWIPKPFGRGYYLLSEPITIPADATREQLARERDRVQAAFEALHVKLDRIIAGEQPAETYRRAA